MTPPSGTYPDVTPLAKVIMSGSMSYRWLPHQCPVRPNPVITSSAMSRMSNWRHSCWTPAKYPSSGGITPPAPMTGSAMNAAISAPRAANRVSSASRSCAPTWTMSPTSVPYPALLSGIPPSEVPNAAMPW